MITKTTAARLCAFFFLLLGWAPLSRSQGLPHPNVDGDPLFSAPPSGTRVYGAIPATRYDVYQLNNATYIDGLFDGITNVSVHPGWGHVLQSQETWVQLRDYNAEVTHLELMNDYYHESTVSYYAIEKGTWNRVLLGTSNGLPTHHWNSIPATPRTTPVKASYIVIVGEPHFPKELKIMGSYIPKALPAPPARPKQPFKNSTGNNFFEWDALESDTDPNERYAIQENKMATLKEFKGGLRHYLDWQRIEVERGVYQFNPTNHGLWNYDLVYKRLKEEGVPVVTCVKTLPDWMLNSWPAGERDGENVPVFFRNTLEETIASFEDPASYIDGGKFFFQFAARYGRNTAVDPALLSGVTTGKVWPNSQESPYRTREIGLGYVDYIEMENERDKWWKGRKGYQTGREYAAMASAYYDGHKGTLGSNVGAKQADPAIRVVLGGLALVRTDYVQGIIDWCRQYRGYKPDGQVDLCFDVINYHQYSNDANSEQYGAGTRGKAPELSSLSTDIDRFLKFANEKCYGMEVWVTEAGFDVHQGSTQKALAIGSKTGKDVQADWILRSSLLYAKKGIDRVMYYMFKDVWEESGGTFATSGFVENNARLSVRRPSADFIKQANGLIGDHTWQATLHADPVVDAYTRNGSTVYVAWIPDETGRTGTYNLTLPSGFARVKRHTPVKGSDMPHTVIEEAPGGVYTIQATETPVFIEPTHESNSTLPLRFRELAARYREKEGSVLLQWITEDEPGTGTCVIERTGDGGRTWTALGSLPFAGGNTGRASYAFTDWQPFPGKLGYRVKEGAGEVKKYSRTAWVAVPAAEPQVLLSPNPARGTVLLSLPGVRRTVAAKVTVLDPEGRQLLHQRGTAGRGMPMKLNLAGLGSGVYFVRVEAGGQTVTQKLLLQ